MYLRSVSYRLFKTSEARLCLKKHNGLKNVNLGEKRKETIGQSDQIGRIFAQWTISYFGQFYKNTEVGRFFLSADYVGMY
jgi:hypothetical protein